MSEKTLLEKIEMFVGEDTNKKIDEEKKISKFDDVHVKSKNVTGMVYDIKGNKVVVQTPSGLVTADLSDVRIVENTEKKSGDDEAYERFFKKKMKEWGIDEITDLSDEEKKKYFDEVDKEWKADNEDKVDEAKKNSIADLPDDIRSGILGWTKDYIKTRFYGNTKMSKMLKKTIDKEIKKHNLKSDEIYFYYGDPDDPKQKDIIKNKLGI